MTSFNALKQFDLVIIKKIIIIIFFLIFCFLYSFIHVYLFWFFSYVFLSRSITWLSSLIYTHGWSNFSRIFTLSSTLEAKFHSLLAFSNTFFNRLLILFLLYLNIFSLFSISFKYYGGERKRKENYKQVGVKLFFLIWVESYTNSLVMKI